MLTSLCAIVMVSALGADNASCALVPYELRCEFASAPLGIDDPAPRLSWKLRAAAPPARNLPQRAYPVVVASAPVLLDQDLGDLWDSGKVVSDKTLHVVYQGVALESGQRVSWKVRVWDQDGVESQYSAHSWWEMGLLSPGWRALWIEDSKDLSTERATPYADHPAPMFRTEFELAKPMRRARAYVSGLGYYEMYLNGERVGNPALDPGWTSYDKRVFYATHDATNLLRPGKNAVGLIAGNGWYNPLPLSMWGHILPGEHLQTGKPRVLLQLVIDYKDGSSQTVVSDESWRVSDSPILRNNIYLGETYDARLELPGWAAAGFDDTAWRSAVAAGKQLGPLHAQPIPPMNRVATITPIARTKIADNRYIFDLGQNFAGRVRLRVTGDAGTRIVMRYGELLYPDGALNPMTAVCGQIKNKDVPEGSEAPSTAWQQDSYTLRGGTREYYEPHFTWHGFRYVEVTGYPGEPPLDALTGIQISSDVESVGAFTCSNEMFTQLQEVVRWTLRSNLSSVQTDCPHREKFGYGGDIVASSEMAMMNFDMASFYAKAARDFADAQRPNGGFTETAPFVGIADGGVGGESGPPGWGIAHPLLLRQLMQYYGDRRVVEEQYDNAKRWVELLRQFAVDGILDYGISDHESLDEKPRALTGTVFYYQSAALLTELAAILGRTDDAQTYAGLANDIRIAFNAHFLKENGIYDTGTQACQAAVLYHKLSAVDEQPLVLGRLTGAIEDAQRHVRTGIFGTKWMLMSLHDNGRSDLAYAIVNQRDFPGWGHMLENGATTLWEHWEFSDNTYSHNHPMFGSVSEWFFKGLAGIAPAPDAVAFNQVTLAPAFVEDLEWVDATYESIRGPIASQWERTHGAIEWIVDLPPNTQAHVLLPAPPSSISESGNPLADTEGIHNIHEQNATTTLRLTSGQYSFVLSTAP